MIKPRRSHRPEWPFGHDAPTERARIVAAYTWSALHDVDAAAADEVAKFFAQWGEAFYLAPTWVDPTMSEPMSRLAVSELAHVTPATVTMWGSRGIVRGGVRHRLKPGPSGRFHPDEVDTFLRLYNTTDHEAPQPTTPG